jgi:hypothetical protein
MAAEILEKRAITPFFSPGKADRFSRLFSGRSLQTIDVDVVRFNLDSPLTQVCYLISNIKIVSLPFNLYQF